MAFEQPPTSGGTLGAQRLRDLGLTITGTPLEPILHTFEAELQQRSVTRPRPRFYLSTEWGVPFGTVAIAVPFYLAHMDLTTLHAERAGLVEGVDATDILRYLRHEMGHVINYAYRLYDQPEWVNLFGDINKDYEEEYHPRPFSRDYVQHLPGWYAQEHPDEDWAETFAVWMTPGMSWRSRYATSPTALAKLEYCERVMTALRDQEPLVTDTERDEDVTELDYSLDDYYKSFSVSDAKLPTDLDTAVQTIFPTAGGPRDTSGRDAAALIRRLERDLMADVYCWTGFFPERLRPLIRRLAERAEQLQRAYAPEREQAACVALTAFLTALAMHQVQGET
jgi:hypothetical protein